MYRNGGKRLFDVGATILVLIVVGPLLVFLGLLVRIMLGAPILFRQRRPGKEEVPFEILKFRSMTDKRDQQGNLMPDVDRLTRFGQLLRRTSLDELPELINVLRGEMSLVGPRPLLMQYLEHYSDEQRRRHQIRPGITGWAQVNGRNTISWEEKFRLDVWYVDNYSLWLDFRIIGQTLAKLVQANDINAPGHATMYYFEGSSTLGGSQTAGGQTEV